MAGDRMTVYCAGDCHVWLGSSSLCTCEVHKALPVPLGDRVAMYGHPMNYNPFGPHAPQPQKASQTDVPLQQFKAAQEVNATHLSKDGLIAYDQRQYGLWYCKWDEGAKRFGSWFKMLDRDLPADAVVIDKE